MLVRHSGAGMTCTPSIGRQHTSVVPRAPSSRPCMSMRQAVRPVQAQFNTAQRQYFAQPCARPGKHIKRGAVQPRAFFDKIFKQDPAEKTRKQYQERVDAINALEPAMQSLSDEQLRAKTQEFKQRVAGGESLESLLPEAFAVSVPLQQCCCASFAACPAVARCDCIAP